MRMVARKNSDPITVALVDAGHNPRQFALNTLGISYELFRWRSRNGKFSQRDCHLILTATAKTFEDLWPNPFGQLPQQVVTNEVVPVLRKPDQQVRGAVKPETAPSAPFALVEVYDNGIPDVD